MFVGADVDVFVGADVDVFVGADWAWKRLPEILKSQNSEKRVPWCTNCSKSLPKRTFRGFWALLRVWGGVCSCA